MPTILAMDTSTAACSVALWRDGGVVASRFEVIERGHAEYLVPMIEAVMAEADERPADIDLIAVSIGPGAFTGIRLGLATARAMALAQDIPCIGILIMSWWRLSGVTEQCELDPMRATSLRARWLS